MIRNMQIPVRVPIRSRERALALRGLYPLREQEGFLIVCGFLTLPFDAVTSSHFAREKNCVRSFWPVAFARWGSLPVFGGVGSCVRLLTGGRFG